MREIGITDRAIDVASLLEAAKSLAEDLRLPEVISRVMTIALINAAAERAVLLLAAKGELSLAAEASVEGTTAYVEDPPLLADIAERVPASLLYDVLRTAKPIVVHVSGQEHRYSSEAYFRGRELSVLCLPIIRRGRPMGLLYFEHSLSPGAFDRDRVELLGLLAGHASSALENARLYENLRDSEIRWRSLVDQLPDYVVLVGRNGSLEYVNAAARPTHTADFQFNAREFVTGEGAETVTAAVERVLRGGTQEALEVRVELSGAAPRWYAVRVAPIVIDGEIDRVIVVSTDIDDRKRAEAQRDRFEAQLRQQQRLDSIGILASGVAHEINNPVQGMINYAELISESAAADAGIRELAREIRHEGRRVTTIIRHLLAFSRRDPSELSGQPGDLGEVTTVAEIVEGTLSLVRVVLRRDQINLSVELPDDLPAVVCRSQQIQQVIMNLVTNARDALNARWQGYDVNKAIDIGARALEGEDGEPWLCIEVSDTGGGVPEAAAAHIFDPFFTTKGRDQGTGLGLAVSHGIVSDHGGRLVLDNRPGVGANFRIELPCAAAPRGA
ncbi:Wide host range VirA protein [Enhygromyxa salina]|uniref:histidine kinase n=1 Tax=Enhygromyxa salina TaxID=215803 RepID=A0A2S9Y4I2_9BACT|nr:sensor histidine kinase [Enhygromyxa salina]PRQ00005.1 Wide host range VirA protein [Enhygromyxa salina]